MDPHSLSKVTVYIKHALLKPCCYGVAELCRARFTLGLLYRSPVVPWLLRRQECADFLIEVTDDISCSVCVVLFVVARRDARHRWRVRGSSYPQLPNVDRRSSCPDNHHCCFLMTMTSSFSERKRERQNKTINLMSFYHRSKFWIERI